MFNLKLTTMESIRKIKEENVIHGFASLNEKELLQIRGGDDGPATQRDHVIN
jgi:hypothetical protein